MGESKQRRGIYVERLIRGRLNEVWRLTQTPELHERWDLRFTTIQYLPKASDSEPQRFLYQTRIGFGLSVAGIGESVGERARDDVSASSALKFASDDWKSLIEVGSGYWRYVPCGENVDLRDEQAQAVRRYMVYSEERQCIVDYLGTHQHLAVDIEIAVAENGGLQLRSGAQRFYEGPIAFNFPMTCSGVADVCEWYDDKAECFRIRVSAESQRWGRLFGYSGRFNVEWLPMAERDVPNTILPKRTERRE